VKTKDPIPAFLMGGGEMGERIREFDWSQTSLGPVEQWPTSLRTCVQIMLTSRQPYWIGWGKDLIKLYNDPYKAIVRGKHPWALGKPASVVWSEIWKDIEPLLNTVMVHSEGTYVESQLLIMERNGYQEETYYTFSYTPVAGDTGKTEGMICANSDDTERILSERQLKTLTQLGKALGDVKTSEHVYLRTIESLSNNTADFPVVLVYSIKDLHATLVAHSELNVSHRAVVPDRFSLADVDELSQLFRTVAEEKKMAVVHDVRKKMGDLPTGAWSISPDKAILLPVSISGQRGAHGILMVGLNPFRLLDQNYESFFNLVADQVATSLTKVHAQEEERKRLEALAEIDRAKTTFFSNISHEFRTPLTLLLGPIQDALQEPNEVEHNRQRMDVAFRNALRMQKLVNLLLDFSRIEAGKLDANFEPVDVVSFTEDLASNFRSAIERAGMKLIVHKQTHSQVAHVDVDMWEKIILNLLSNAFKYTEKGSIEVFIRTSDSFVEVAIKDTGIGIPETELDNIFERFHRIQNGGGRSQEGTGIGLAMVKELVRLNEGTIHVESKLGVGSTFTVRVPVTKKSMVSGKNKVVTKLPSAGSVYIEEALQWIPGDSDVPPELPGNNQNRFKVLLADDNSDMRKYVSRLLHPDYRIVLASDGEEAFTRALGEKPDLILSDIMMPKLDGFGLLQKLKSNLATRNIPFIFLSARAGEEARVEGIMAGADDYLTKPFSSRELLARVSNHIAISNTRRETEREFYNLFLQSPAHIHVMKGPEHIFEFFHPLGIPFTGRDVTGMKARDAIPSAEGQGFFEMLDKVYREGIPVSLHEARAVLTKPNGETSVHYFNITYQPWRDLHGNVKGVLQFTFEVTDTVNERLKAEASERNFKAVVEQAPVIMCVLKGPDHVIQIANNPVLNLWGRSYEEVINRPIANALPEIVEQGIIGLLDNVYESGKPFHANEMPVELLRDGKRNRHYLNFIYEPFFNSEKQVSGIIVVAVDVTEQVTSRRIIEEAESGLKNAIELSELGTWTYDVDSDFVSYSSRVAQWWGLPQEGARMEAVLAYVHPEDRQKVAAAIHEAIAGKGSYEAEYRLINAVSLRERFIQAKGNVFFDDHKKPVRLTGIVRDVTIFRMIQNELERKVNERTAELQSLNVELSRSNEELRQFAYVASHDLQEPLRKIRTFSDMLKGNVNDPAFLTTYLSKIESSAARMSALIKDVLLFSQVTRETVQHDPVDIKAVIENVKSDFELLITQKNGKIIYTELPTLRGNSLQFYQLFSNLINNSLKFSKGDSLIEIDYAIRTGGEISSAKLDVTKKYHCLEVRDNGIGFDPAYSEQIFELFNRLHNKNDYSGTGIGLALCRKIVENHHGVMKASSVKGEGAVFFIYLPVD